jgi:hypothetical protein
VELPSRPTEICASVEKSILRATTLQSYSKGACVAVIQLLYRSRTAVAAQPANFAIDRQTASQGLSRLPHRNKSCVLYHGIHFPFFGSMSFLGINLIQPSRLASFLSGTWPM